MAGVETRNIQRDSLFLSAEVRIAGEEGAHRVKVRNLSARGMMAEGEVSVLRGAQVFVELRNVGSIEGSVAWVQGDRFGIAFACEIDPKLVRTPVGNNDVASPRFTRPASLPPTFGHVDGCRVRKI